MPTAKKPASSSEEEVLFEIQGLLDKVSSATLPPDLKSDIEENLTRLNRAMKHGIYQQEYEQTASYVEWVLGIPWAIRSEDNLDLKKAKEILDQSHFGLEKIKERILEYLSVLKLHQVENDEGVLRNFRSNVICFVGLPGTGKTSFAESIANAMGRSFGRIAMGGMSSPMVLRGQPRSYASAEPGSIVKTLARAGTRNPVILLDEIDSIARGAESDIMGVLLELLDPEQNYAFTDYFVNYPIDLSEVLFICSANRMGNITPAVMDRLEIILMPRYSDEDKVKIARDYLLPRELENTAVERDKVIFQDDAWPYLIKPFGYEIDIRNIQRTLNGVLRKVARKIVEGESGQVVINSKNYRDFLPEW